MIGIDQDIYTTIVIASKTAGVPLLNYQVTAASNWAKRAKSNGYWTKLARADFMLGRNVAGALFSARVATGLTNPAVQGTPSVIVDANIPGRMGIINTSGGTNQSIDTGINPSTWFPDNSSIMISAHIGMAPIGLQAGLGTYGASTTNPSANMYFDASNVYGNVFSAADISAALPATKPGLYTLNRKTTALVRIYKDGVPIIADTASAATGRPNGNIYLTSLNGNPGITVNGNLNRFFSFYIGSGFTDTDVLNLGNDNTILMNELRRTG